MKSARGVHHSHAAGAPRRPPAPPWTRPEGRARTGANEGRLALRCRLASASFVAAALMGAGDSVSDIADPELSAALQRALARAIALCHETRERMTKEGA